MPLRYHCSLDGMEENWVEVNPIWTRKEMRELTETQDITVIEAFWARKILACRIETLDGEPVTDPALLTAELAESSLDARLCDFLGYVLMQAAAHLRTLGPLSGRLSSDTAGTKTTKTAE
ncbi:MAG: hypothetical protein NUV63_03165 [Gallionella sp.]|nr:hypothetical protein [Gallionella sp.]